MPNPHLQALKVHQWLPEWDNVSFDETQRRRKPKPYFYIFSIDASQLRALCGIYRRDPQTKSRASDMGIQRQHDPGRSEEIARFVKHGYPWSSLSPAKRHQEEFADFRKPGWLPTAIVVNILEKGAIRRQTKIAPADVIEIHEEKDITKIILPTDALTSNWEPQALPPIEVIDGQHRLWAFDDSFPSDGQFQLPVVAFHGLDISWQAYLFWTINIKPKKINASLAFDLYPLLRAEDWLEKAEDHAVYRETRSQELTEALWSHPKSPWYQHINMLGDRGKRGVTQAAWIRNLMSTMVKRWEGPRIQIGGLFGAKVGSEDEVLGWSRAQQAAFLIYAWDEIRKKTETAAYNWCQALSENPKPTTKNQKNCVFYHEYCLFMTDQGVRGVLHVINDLVYIRADDLQLQSWHEEDSRAATDEEAVTHALQNFRKTSIAKFLTRISEHLVEFDWRTSRAPSLTEYQRQLKLAYRGSGGYKELRRQLLNHLSKKSDDVGEAAHSVMRRLHL